MNGSKSWAIPNERGQDSPAASLITVGTLALVLVFELNFALLPRARGSLVNEASIKDSKKEKN
jgi:hypothetical protein